MHLLEGGKLVLVLSLFLSLASALPPSVPKKGKGGDYGDAPAKYCTCLRPGDGRQDPDITNQVCPDFKQYGTSYTEFDFGGKGGGYIGACAKIGFDFKEKFGKKCIAIYGKAGNDGEAGAQCCELDTKSKSYSCEDYPPDPS
ncbi:hypothetical protein AC579_7045 [Pseudocercospora musae]|uniref:Hydrophobin n=1 Tax=Pseudocercospora musae TaxID=113226 RepID=A0A139IAB7_9PEZI|nr:hypothetical protein AC579_7045 [Pseudocercospora musae]